MGHKIKVWFFRNNELQSEIRYITSGTKEMAKKALIKSGVYKEGEIQNILYII